MMDYYYMQDKTFSTEHLPIGQYTMEDMTNQWKPVDVDQWKACDFLTAAVLRCAHSTTLAETRWDGSTMVVDPFITL